MFEVVVEFLFPCPSLNTDVKRPGDQFGFENETYVTTYQENDSKLKLN